MINKCIIYAILAVLLTGCSAKEPSKDSFENTIISRDTSYTAKNDSIENITENPYANYFIVIADTNTNYFTLQKKLFKLNKQLHFDIDTMGRYFNKTKQLIALPDNDVDEIYAGTYYPRRNPSVSLSLEYLNYYQDKANPKTIALVTGITVSVEEADSVLATLKKIEKSAFKIKAKVYIGCMH